MPVRRNIVWQLAGVVNFGRGRERYRNSSAMVWYDIVVLVILAVMAWRGAQRGLVTQLAWIAAVVLSFKFSDSLAPTITPHIGIGEPGSRVRH